MHRAKRARDHDRAVPINDRRRRSQKHTVFLVGNGGGGGGAGSRAASKKVEGYGGPHENIRSQLIELPDTNRRDIRRGERGLFQ